MPKVTDRELIIDFLFDTELYKNHTYITDRICNDSNVQEIYKEEKDYFDIDRYLNNEMSFHENLEFEIKLKNNPELEKEIQLWEDIDLSLYVMSVTDDCHAKMKKEELLGLQSSDSQVTTVNVSRKMIHWVAVTVLLLFFAMNGSMHLQPKSNTLEDKLFAEYYESHLDKELIVLGNYFDKADNTDSLTSETDLLKKLSETNTLKGRKQILFVSINLIKQERFDEAKTALLELYNNESLNDAVLKSVTGWHLGMCYLKEKSNVEASVYLRYVSNRGAYKSKEAKEILEKLEKAKS